jgi:hypothetical protein
MPLDCPANVFLHAISAGVLSYQCSLCPFMISPLVSSYPPLSAAPLLLFSPFLEVGLVNVCRVNCKESQSILGEVNRQTIYSKHYVTSIML